MQPLLPSLDAEPMNIIVNDDLKAYIDPLTADEYEALERSILTEGCRDALVLWDQVLVDGHNRYAICQAHGLPFQTVQSSQFKSMEDVHLWMIDQHLGRRSVSDFQRGVLALRKQEIVAERRARVQVSPVQAANTADEKIPADGQPWDDDTASSPSGAPVAPPAPASREDIAKTARVSPSQMVMIEKIHKQATPEVVAAVKSGVISINAAAAVASLPAQEQVAAAAAGKDELKQAAKRVRDAKRKPREVSPESPDGATSDAGVPAADEIKALQKRISVLEAENDALRKQVLNLLAK